MSPACLALRAGARVRGLALAAVLPGAACGPEAPVPRLPVDDAEADVVVAGCDGPVGGIELGDAPEAGGDFAASLAALPGRIADAGAPRWETADLSPFLREVVAWMLEVPLAELGTLSSSSLLLQGPLGQAVALAFLEGDGRRPDVDTLRRGLHHGYACVRRLPLALSDALALAGGLDPATVREVPSSVPKGHPRRLVASRDQTLFAAETLIDGAVRETEILWRDRRRDGALDFLVYDDAGRLRGGSTFITSAGPETAAAAPYACLACHRDRQGGAGFVVIVPTGP